MKQLFSFLALTTLLGSSQAFAYFQCDFDFKIMGHSSPVWVQLENLDNQEAIVFREPGTKEGSKDGVYIVAQVIEKKKTRIGSLVRASITENGQTAFLTLKLPDVLPGRGTLHQDGNAESSLEMDCRRK